MDVVFWGEWMKKYYTTSDDKMGKILIPVSLRETDEDKI